MARQTDQNMDHRTSQIAETVIGHQETSSLHQGEMKMDAQFKAKWIEALRSGEYKQCQGALTNGAGYCCIGVAAVVAGYEMNTALDRIVRPGESAEDVEGYEAVEDFGLRNRGSLIMMNDSGKSFSEIADYIEAEL